MMDLVVELWDVTVVEGHLVKREEVEQELKDVAPREDSDESEEKGFEGS